MFKAEKDKGRDRVSQCACDVITPPFTALDPTERTHAD